MKALFIQDNGINESLALTELSAYLRANGHHTDLVIERDERDLLEEIRHLDPDIFIIPCEILAHCWALGMAKRIKENFQDKLIVLGGTHPTFYNELINEENFDIMLIGEAEEAILELLDKLSAGQDITKIKNLWIKKDGKIYKNPLRPLISNLDSLPIPHRDLYYKYSYIRDFKWKKFMSGRGCYNSCSYCYNPAFHELYRGKGVFVRRKGPRRVVDEIAYIKNNYPLKVVHFSDDLFAHDQEWVEEFADEYKDRVGLPFTCNMTADLANKRVVSALKRGGCRGIAIGIETGNERLRASIMNKIITDEDIRNAARIIKDHDIKLITFNMIANPGESLGDAIKTFTLNKEIGTDYARLTFAIPIPNTMFAEYGLKKGLLDGKFLEDIYNYPDLTVSRPGPVFKSEFKRQFKNLYLFFRLGIMFPFPLSIIKKLINLPPNPIFNFLNIVTLYNEKKIFNLDLLDGLRYFLHVGSPDKRTTNYVTLI